MPQIYISYSNSDRTITGEICNVLEAAGIRCLRIPRDIIPGEESDAVLDKCLDRSDGLIAILSAEANRSERVHREIARAVNRHIPILAVQIEDFTPSDAFAYLPVVYVQWFDARTRPIERHFSRLVAAARRMVGYQSADSIATKAAIEPRASERALPHPTAAVRLRVDRRMLALILLFAMGTFLSFLVWSYRNVDDRMVEGLISRSREASLLQPPRITSNLDIADVDVFFPSADLPETPIVLRARTRAGSDAQNELIAPPSAMFVPIASAT
jgi:hypothetical protein